MGDLVFQILFSTFYDGPNWNVVLAIAANLGLTRAAIHFLEDPMPAGGAPARPPMFFSPLPVLAVSVLALVLVWMSTSGQATNLGALVAGLVLLNATLVVRDVLTSRTAAQALQAGAQREAARRLEALVRNASDAILLLDDAGRLLFASPPADRLLGRAASALDGVTFASLLPADEGQAWARFLAGLRAQPGPAISTGLHP